MNSENDLSVDLNNIMTDFNKFKQFYLREQMLRHKFEGVSKNLQEENKVIRNLEKSERDKLNTSREFTLQQQNIISDLLVVESENIKLLEHIKQLEGTLADTKRQLIEEKEKWENDQEKIKLNRSQEIEEMRLNCEKRVREAEQEVEDITAKFHTQYSELAKKFKDIETEKSNEINVIIFKYEERLHKMEERLNATEAESRKIQDRAAADVVLYQKKVLALEQQYNSMIQEKVKSAPSTMPPNSAQSFIPGTASRKSFQYHVPSNINQSQSATLPLRPVLKKTSAYKSRQSSSDKENVLPSADEFSNHEFIGAGEGTHVEHSTEKISAEVFSVSTNVCVGDSNVGATSSVTPQLQFVTEPPDLDTVSNISLNTESNSSTRGKRTRFAAAKKRKLFSSSAQDTL